MKQIYKKIVVMLCCMSLPVYAPVARGPKKGGSASLPSEEIHGNSSDDLFAMTFNLVEYAVKQDPVINLSLYDATLAWQTTKDPVIQAVDRFIKESLIVPTEQEKKEIILNAQTLQDETNALWPFEIVHGSGGLTKAQIIAKYFFKQQLEFALSGGVSLGAMPVVSYDYIEGQVKFNTVELFGSLPDYSKGFLGLKLFGVQSLQDLYKKYVTYMVQKQVNNLIAQHEVENKTARVGILDEVAERAADIDDSSKTSSEKTEEMQKLTEAAIPALAENIALSPTSLADKENAAKSASQELADLTSQATDSKQAIAAEEAQVFQEIMEQIQAFPGQKPSSKGASLSNVIDLISRLSVQPTSKVNLVSVIEVVDALRMQRARV